MNVDIQTEGIAMRSEWHHMLDAWVERCRRHHPSVAGIDVAVRLAIRPDAGEVEVVANTRGRRLRAATRSSLVSATLHDALDALEYELLVHDAVSRAA